ncbi:hypothetical protein Tco_0730024 [Tanacetum coccineum]|uniref:EF-hand domain-containing protein n=1 Tax=Tanacetum coccineum TaxID=301880 RepID=A0ABQ4YQL9_9ASTR
MAYDKACVNGCLINTDTKADDGSFMEEPGSGTGEGLNNSSLLLQSLPQQNQPAQGQTSHVELQKHAVPQTQPGYTFSKKAILGSSCKPPVRLELVSVMMSQHPKSSSLMLEAMNSFIHNCSPYERRTFEPKLAPVSIIHRSSIVKKSFIVIIDLSSSALAYNEKSVSLKDDDAFIHLIITFSWFQDGEISYEEFEAIVRN